MKGIYGLVHHKLSWLDSTFLSLAPRREGKGGMIARPGSVGDRWIGSYISSTQHELHATTILDTHGVGSITWEMISLSVIISSSALTILFNGTGHW